MPHDLIRQAYEEASLTWTGCDWRTRHGRTSLDLEGCKSSEVADQAIYAGNTEAKDLMSAADWLAEVELGAAEAQQQGDEAMEAARSGDLYEALRHAQRACWIEQKTGRTAERAPAWPRLCHAIAQAIKDFEQHLEANVGASAGPAESLQDCLRFLGEELGRHRQYLQSFQTQLKRLATRLERLEREPRASGTGTGREQPLPETNVQKEMS